jgi:predicted O-methyltransferase YrrM
VDYAHGVLVYGLVCALKPDVVVEVGWGSGYSSGWIREGMAFNGKGMYLLVENWSDWRGEKQSLPDGVVVEVTDEGEWIRGRGKDSVDFLMMDGDHAHSHEYVGEALGIVRRGGCVVWHDTARGFAGMQTIPAQVRELGYQPLCFTQRSREDEQCDRGLTVVVKL